MSPATFRKLVVVNVGFDFDKTFARHSQNYQGTVIDINMLTMQKSCYS
jgi:hypothetical protein